MNDTDIHMLTTIARDILPGTPDRWPSAWPGEIEAALLDAVFSARATYGGPESGVRRVVTRWREHRGAALDSLPALAAFAGDADALAGILGNRQRVPGNYTTKAEAAALAAARLVDAGIASASHIDDGRLAWDAVTSVPGLGGITWEMLMLQLGLVGPRALGVVSEFVSHALGFAVTDDDALDALAAAAEELGVEPGALRHAVWRRGRSRA